MFPSHAPATPIDVSLIEPTVLNPYAARPTEAQRQAETQLRIEEARKPEETRDPEGQVVDIAKPNVEIRPDEARFLAEYDSKVEKETKGKPGDGRAGARKEVASVTRPQTRPSPPVPEVAPVPARPPTVGDRGSSGRGALAMRSQEREKDRGVGKEDGMTATSREGTETKEGARPESPEAADTAPGQPGETQPGTPGREGQQGSPGAPESLPSVSDLRPSDEMVAQALGVGSNDYLRDIDEGADTLLNTKRWKYASFFTRVKRGVAQTWKPDQAYRLRDPTGQIYGQKNRFTVLKVSLKPDGSLSEVMVEKGCGVDFLDDEAVNSFKVAQPFPNPPPGLVDPESKLITFRFGFYFEISGAPTFRVFRN